jgi:hypothetical protein
MELVRRASFGSSPELFVEAYASSEVKPAGSSSSKPIIISLTPISGPDPGSRFSVLR